MRLEVGIVGLPRSGKTTLFNALTHAGAAIHDAKPHVGMAPIADGRLDDVARVEGSAKSTPATIRVQDVPGTGPALLGNLRRVDALSVSRTASRREPILPATSSSSRSSCSWQTATTSRQGWSGCAHRRSPGIQATRRRLAALEGLLAHLDSGGAFDDYAGDVPEELEPLTTKPRVVVENGPGGIDLAFELELAELPEDEAAEFRDGPSALEEVVRRLGTHST